MKNLSWTSRIHTDSFERRLFGQSVQKFVQEYQKEKGVIVTKKSKKAAPSNTEFEKSTPTAPFHPSPTALILTVQKCIEQSRF